jgi:hypothetical protein
VQRNRELEASQNMSGGAFDEISPSLKSASPSIETNSRGTLRRNQPPVPLSLPKNRPQISPLS